MKFLDDLLDSGRKLGLGRSDGKIFFGRLGVLVFAVEFVLLPGCTRLVLNLGEVDNEGIGNSTKVEYVAFVTGPPEPARRRKGRKSEEFLEDGDIRASRSTVAWEESGEIVMC